MLFSNLSPTERFSDICIFTKTMIELLDVNPETDSLEIVFEKNVATIKKSEQNK